MGGGQSFEKEPILVYDSPKPTAIQQHSLLKARVLEDGRLYMPIAGSDDDTNAHLGAADHKRKQLLAFAMLLKWLAEYT